MITDADVDRWLREDVGHHDVVNDVPGETTGRLVAKESGVAAGIDAARAVFDYLGVRCESVVEPGDRVEPGDVVVRTTGPARETLRGERVAVNVVGHASGVATKTARAVEIARSAQGERAAADPVTVAATRKTTPGLRGVEKRAVVAGGGDTHRLNLSHMVLVKENHIAELGLERAIERFRERASYTTKIECEVEEPADGPRAAEAGADIVLFDNFSPAALRDAVERLPENVTSEASGGITLETLPEYATTGVDVVSMGSLTHSADTLDLSFRTG